MSAHKVLSGVASRVVKPLVVLELPEISSRVTIVVLELPEFSSHSPCRPRTHTGRTSAGRLRASSGVQRMLMQREMAEKKEKERRPRREEEKADKTAEEER